MHDSKKVPDMKEIKKHNTEEKPSHFLQFLTVLIHMKEVIVAKIYLQASKEEKFSRHAIFHFSFIKKVDTDGITRMQRHAIVRLKHDKPHNLTLQISR